MNRPAALLVALLMPLAAARLPAATAYVSDELILGVFAEQNGQGQRLTTLHSGASVETLAVNGEFTQVRLNDGTTGWVKSTYLTTREPATTRVKALEEELDRMRATTPALAEAAARSEVLRLKRELATSGTAANRAGDVAGAAAPGAAVPGIAGAGTDAAQDAQAPAGEPAGTARSSAAAGAAAGAAADVTAGATAGAAARAPATTFANASVKARVALLGALAALALGFWLGYATLARRVRHKFGGIKVY